MMVDKWKIMDYLGTHNDKMCAEISTGNTPNTPRFIRPICPNRPIIWDIFFKSPHVNELNYFGQYLKFQP